MKALLLALVLMFVSSQAVFAQEAGSTGVLGIAGLTTGGAVGIAAAVIITAVVLSDMDGTTGTTD